VESFLASLQYYMQYGLKLQLLSHFKQMTKLSFIQKLLFTQLNKTSLLWLYKTIHTLLPMPHLQSPFSMQTLLYIKLCKQLQQGIFFFSPNKVITEVPKLTLIKLYMHT